VFPWKLTEAQFPNKIAGAAEGVLRTSSVAEQSMDLITVYGTGWCPDCWRVKAFLKQHGFEFQEVNIEKDPQGEEIVLRANEGRRKVPTLRVGERYFGCSPFNAQQLADVLKIPLNR
jgi:mycoredoxin